MTVAGPDDLRIAALVRAAVARVPAAGRFGARKVFIAAIADAMMGTLAVIEVPLAGLQTWLLRARILAGPDGRPLVDLARADVLGAMDASLVARSETKQQGGGVVHFVVDAMAREPWENDASREQTVIEWAQAGDTAKRLRRPS